MKKLSRHKTSRRFAVDIYGTGGEALRRRLHVPPGGFRRAKRRSEYARQLEEKQKLKATYGLSETQLRRYYERARRSGKNPAQILLELIERRLDNVVYRLGFARTRAMARQLVSQGHVRVNQCRVDRPSYQVGDGETVELTDRAAAIPAVAEAIEEQRPVPGWLARENRHRGRVLASPTTENLDRTFEMEKIIAFYSR